MGDRLLDIIQRMASGESSEADMAVLRELLASGDARSLSQLGKYNVHIGEGRDIHVGDRVYYQWNDEAIKALIQELRKQQVIPEQMSQYLKSEEACQNRQAVEQYLTSTLQKLRQHGCLDIRQDIAQGSETFSHAARIQDFELPFGPISMRGEAFFIFSEFSAIQMNLLRQFSGQALQWAKKQTEPGAVGQAIFNFRVPTHLCFALALVDDVDEAMKDAVRSTNPLDHKVDLLWYEVPLIYELSQAKLYFYDQPAGFLENFKGEIAWQQLRSVIQKLLSPSAS
ncbi:MAG: hypothetical protein AAF215_02265 [Cyanobacteria bacterium P01_A01_bin.123]